MPTRIYLNYDFHYVLIIVVQNGNVLIQTIRLAGSCCNLLQLATISNWTQQTFQLHILSHEAVITRQEGDEMLFFLLL